MQSTLKRGLYAPETTALQALGSFLFVGLVRSLGVPGQSRRSCCFGSAWVGVRCPMFIANATKRIATPLVGRVSDSFAWRYVYSEFCFLGNCIFLHSTCLVRSTAHALRSAGLVLQGTGFLWHWYQKVSNDPS